MKKIVLVLLAVSLFLNAVALAALFRLDNNFSNFSASSNRQFNDLGKDDLALSDKIDASYESLNQKLVEAESKSREREDGLSGIVGNVKSSVGNLDKKLAAAETDSQKRDADIDNKLNESSKALLQKMASVDSDSKVRDEFLNGEIKNISSNLFDAVEIFSKSLKSVVVIKIDGELNGSGFIYTKSNLIVTAFHVVAGYEEQSITVQYFNGLEVPAKIMAYSEDADIAILKVVDSGLAPLVPAAKVSVGESIAVIGHPYNFSYSLSVGTVSAVNRRLSELPNITEIQIDAVVAPGSSGAVVLNRKGEVIGFVNRMAEQFGFIVPIRYVELLLKQIGSP